jgi:phosphatidylinositol alpha 1,6-mannosyltransferase
VKGATPIKFISVSRRRRCLDAQRRNAGAMRVALVTESFFPAVDESTTTVKAVADHLVDAGHAVLLVAAGPGLTTYRGARVVRVGRRDGDRVREALTAFGPDLVHVTTPGAVGRRALRHARGLGARVLVAQQAPVPGPLGARWRATVAERADTVLVTATWMVDHLAGLGVPAEPWLPGVDTRAFTPRLRDDLLHARWARTGRPGDRRIVVGYAGGLHRRDGVAGLAGLGELTDTRLVVVGEAPPRRLRSRLPGVRFTGPLATGDLAVVLASLDALAHPGRHETCAHLLRAAAASGVPVVAPRAGGAIDVVHPLQTGLLHDPDDPRGLVEGVATLTTDPRRRLLGERGRALAVRRDWCDAVDELVSRHYQPLVGRHPAPTAA